MHLKQPVLALGVLLSTTTFNANASLTSYTVNGANLVYSSLGNITWTADGNLFQTLESGYAGGATAFVNAVIASVPGGRINDTPNMFDTPTNSGYHTLSGIDFNTVDGNVNWFGAKAFITYLNSINYGGSNQWRLPTWTDTGTAGPQFGYSGTDSGYNVNTASGELAKLYYDELGKKAYYTTSGVSLSSGYGIFGNSGVAVGTVGPFTNVLAASLYWLGTEYAPLSGGAWGFSTHRGGQDSFGKNSRGYAWAVSLGQVAAVPIPGAVWLFGTGIVGLLGLKRRGHSGN